MQATAEMELPVTNGPDQVDRQPTVHLLRLTAGRHRRLGTLMPRPAAMPCLLTVASRQHEAVPVLRPARSVVQRR